MNWFKRLWPGPKQAEDGRGQKPKRITYCGWTRVDGVYRSPSQPGVAVHGSKRCWFRTDENGMVEFTNFHEAIGAPLHFPAPLIPPSEDAAEFNEGTDE